MPQPRRQPPRQPQQPKQTQRADQAAAGTATGAGPAAAVATAAALAAIGVPTPGIGLPHGRVTPAVRAASAAVLEGIDTLFRQRRGELREYVRAVAETEMPGAEETRVRQLVEAETRREVEYQRKARLRMNARLPLVLAEQDPVKRKAALQALVEAEKRILRQRAEASASRVVALLEQDLLKDLSPDGAFWQLSNLVREHTIGCIAMAGKFWPWKVLEHIHPQLHGGCQCRLYGKSEAVKAGLMHPDDAPELGIVPQAAYDEWVGECVRYGELVIAEERQLVETMGADELAAAVRDLEGLRLLEARNPLRFGKGLAKGGEFMPQRGADRGPLSKKASAVGQQLKLTQAVAPVAPSAPGRDVTIQGQDRRIPQAPHWEERIGGVKYTSPAGDTSLYRDGVLIGQDHPDLASDAGTPYEPQQANTLPPVDAAPKLPPVDGIPDYTGVELRTGKDSHAGGSTGAQIATDKSGQRWLVKSYGGSQDRVATELLANAVYRAMGANAADAGMLHHEGEPDFASIKDVKLEEPPLPKGRVSTGIIVREPDGRVWLYEPKGHFGGYEHTFPKGGLEHGLSPQQNAHKELWEETGLHAAITGYVGDFKGDTGTSRYYLATKTGGEPHPDDATPYVKGGSETAAVKLLSPEEAGQALNRDRDKTILKAVLGMPVPQGGQPDAFPENAKHVALTYPLVEGEARPSIGGGKTDPWSQADKRAMGEHYMTDALVGNWDFVGLTRDNVLWGGDGKPVRIDQGGTFQYRAQGQPKPFGPIPTETWTMRGPKGQGFGTVSVTDGQMRDQAQAIGDTLTDDRIDQLVDQAPFKDQAMREEIRDALKARVQWMRDFGDGTHDLPRPLEGDEARQQLTLEQRGMDVLPEEHAAVDDYVSWLGSEVNTHLRSGAKKDKASAEVRATVAGLDSLLKRSRLDDDVYAYLPTDPAKLGDLSELEGRTLRDDGFATAALSRGDLNAPGVIRVTVPAGQRALYVQGVEGLEDAPQDASLILPRGARMRVVRVRENDGRLVAEAVVI